MSKRELIQTPEDIAKMGSRHKRILQIVSAEGSGPKNMLPSDMWGRNEMIRTRCAMCGKPLTIRPHFYAHWMRRRDGTIAHLCGACDYTPLTPWKGQRVER